MFQDLQTSTSRLTFAFAIKNHKQLYFDSMVVAFRMLKYAFGAAQLLW